jgi:hypothetical protein
MKIKNCILLFTFIISTNIKAQNLNKHDHEHVEDCTHHKSEIAIGSTLVYFPGEKSYAPGFHAHYVYNFSGTRFGIGLGYEKILDEQRHNTIGIIANYRPLSKLNLMFSPGITLASHENPAHLSAHFETTYEFVYKIIHFGPVVGIGWDGEDYHIGAGIHIGIGF